MDLPDYAELRRRAGVARAEEMRRLSTLLQRLIRRAARFIKRSGPGFERRFHGGLRPVPVRNRRWPAPYDLRRDDY